ncbi:MAG TPA: DUF4430 domain-containing protein [Candidatus Saccharimonadales bacterium]|nr:DUF4430 domain-containing protein [Candidatus Saccharimonadales bacterium]
MNNIKTRVLTSGIAAAILIVGIVTVALINKPRVPGTQAVQGAQASQQQSDNHVTFVATKGTNVLDQLKVHATVEIKNSQQGPFVDAVNGKKEEGKLWRFYVDSQSVQASAAEYVTQGGEKIEWKLE